SSQHPPTFYVTMWRDLIVRGHWSGEIWNRHKDGKEYAAMITIGGVRDIHGKTQHYVALLTDITLVKEYQKQLEHLAHYDPLTHLPNRVLLADRLRQAMAGSQRHGHSLAVVYLDLDGFKEVNDHHGHDVGDELLIAVSHQMKEALRDSDTLARIGGDEFVAVLVDLEQSQDWEPVLTRLLRAIANPVMMSGVVLQVFASIGVTLYPRDDADADQLLRHADQAMYIAKQAGKNRYHLFDVAQDTAMKTQQGSLDRIRQALEQDEFLLYYQPKVNMKTGRVIGAEALIRWQHPERGLLSPAAFLPIVENHPFSVELGDWVLDTALAQLVEWRAQGLDLSLSVNIGACQLQQSDFATHLREKLAVYPTLSPDYLELEVLESSALEDMAQVTRVMRVCREIGVRFALDDFGTGYSSLTYLRRLPADVLKIDQSFVRDMLDDPDDLAIVKGVVGLATAFRRQVIAEGVETVAHGELLLALGCQLAQGYGIARPMPAVALPAWVMTWRADAAWTTWRDCGRSRSELAVFAEVEHRHWIRAMGKFLAGDQDVLPPMDGKKCYFGRWQSTEGQACYGKHPIFSVMVAIHDHVHLLGQELVDLHAQGQPSEALERMKELQTLSDDLMGRLRQLVRGEDT
ncbi:MAG: EAL domain-containing protein, partial [Pseudomonadota bacterium]